MTVFSYANSEETMIYPANFEKKIGFTEIRTQLKGRCMSALGTEWVDKQLHFMTSAEEVRQALAEAETFARFSEEHGDEVESEFFDVREALLHIRPERTYLEELDLFNLKRSLKTVQGYVELFNLQSDGDTETYPIPHNNDDEEQAAVDAAEPRYVYAALAGMTRGVATFPDIIAGIDAVLNKYGKVKDTASPELLTLRHQIEVTVRSISHSLRTIISDAQASGYIDRDVAPTLRDGRLVIPVAPALKRKIKGIVHDESATGKTVFIEPAAVVDANNRIRELKAAERREVMRILQAVSATIRPHIQDILGSLHFLAHVDYLRALMLFSEAFRTIVPQVEADPVIDWRQARHPLLEQSLLRHDGKIVPLDVSLPQGRRILLISGPNAGGKSVCLKTVGLLQYMVQCGMPIPADERTKVGVFDSIFLDMGDEQSIENDLSTYSSHLLNMKTMMRQAGPRSLLLIDEFGGGTEPQIGGALAEAFLSRFVKNRCYGIITTHYQNLKHFAEKDKAVVNGAMLYDRAQMQPLFMLQVGHPGSSFAVEIARKIGIPEEVIAYATDIVGRDYVMSDKYLQDIVRDKMYWETKRRNIRQREKQLEDTQERYEREMTELQQERRGILAQAKADAQQLLEESNAQIENTIRSIREAQAEKAATRQARAELADFRERLQEDTDEQDRIARKMAKIQRRRQRKEEGGETARQRNMQAEATAATALRGKVAGKGNVAPGMGRPKDDDFGVGDTVRIKGQSVVGTIKELTGSSARVLFGMMYSQVALKKLEHAEMPQQPEGVGPAATFVSKQTRDMMYEKKLHFKPEIDIRGMHVDEALNAIAYFIDDSIQFEQARVRILHGTGTGALRELVRQYLHTVPGVKRYHDEHVQFGGAGITVVELE